jgi:hypothetical protein
MFRLCSTTMPTPIPVLCDRCQASGIAGEGDFAALGDLLDFEPVALQVERVDGWSPECQRAFIAALSVLGSADRAAKAVGKSATGAERLRRLPGSESFARAWERAKAISYEKGTLRLANSLRTAKADRTAPAPKATPEPSEADRLDTERKAQAIFDSIFRHYRNRIALERETRLEGKVVEADFYVRQITGLEILLDLICTGHDPLPLMEKLGAAGDEYVDIAETWLSRLLDEARRRIWAEQGEPERPPLLTDEQTIDRGGYKLFADQSLRGGPDWRERERAQKAGYEAAARAQVEWEEKARREAAAWRERLAAAAAPAGAGAPAPEAEPPPPGEGGPNS